MYTPAQFRIEHPEECIDVIERCAVGTIVVATEAGFEATLLPWLVECDHDGRVRLLGHMSKANPLVALLGETRPALVTFDLVDGYISPSWYASKAEHGRVVPTWNYVAVHAHGSVRLVDERHWLRSQIGRLTDRHEAAMPAPWSVDDAPDGYIDQTMKGIVGLEVHVARLEGKAKLSQNRNAADRAGVVAGLAASGDDELWAAMAFGDGGDEGEAT